MTSSTGWPCVALRHAELADRTTMHVGGRVEWLLEPRTPAELSAAWKLCHERGLHPRILGGGANLVIDDGLLPGVVVTTERMRRIYRPTQESFGEGELAFGGAPRGEMALPNPAEDPRLVAWAGCTLPALVRAARQLGYSGMEGLVGVPGQVGGALAMNAGGKWGDMWDVVERVLVLEPDGSLKELPRADCSPSYRDGGLGRLVAVGAVLRFEPQPKSEIQDRMATYLVEKNRTQPVTQWSSGCIFKNPDLDASGGRSAGGLVEDCGCKLLRYGDAEVSGLHGNFIINRGKATAADVFALMEEVQTRVLDQTGIRLAFEVRRWRP